MILEALAATLICLDPGHGTVPSVGVQREPIGPGSRTLKIKDPPAARPARRRSRLRSPAGRARSSLRVATASR